MEYKVERTIEDAIKQDFFKGKVVVVSGPRQIGKTTLIQHILKDYDKVLFLNADNPTDKSNLQGKDFD